MPENAFRSVQIELMLPHEIEAALAARSVVYLPLGTYEWHGNHLPIGLDALTAHGICVRAAACDGGLVCPPFYYGTGGDHARYPWSVMMDDDAEIAALLRRTLARMQDFGVSRVVLVSGHFAPAQIEMIERLASEWNAGGGAMHVLQFAMNGAGHLPIAPDHAAEFETTLLYALWPDRVQLERLPPLASHPASDPAGDAFGSHRHDPAHSLYGIIGPDPREFDPARSRDLLEGMVAWVVDNVRAAKPALNASRPSRGDIRPTMKPSREPFEVAVHRR